MSSGADLFMRIFSVDCLLGVLGNLGALGRFIVVFNNPFGWGIVLASFIELVLDISKILSKLILRLILAGIEYIW